MLSITFSLHYPFMKSILWELPCISTCVHFYKMSDIHTVMLYRCFTLERFDFCQQTLDVSCVGLVNILFSRHHSITYHTYQLCTSTELHFFALLDYVNTAHGIKKFVRLFICPVICVTIISGPQSCVNSFSNWLPWTIHSDGFEFVKKHFLS